ncbi:DUF2252_family protein [Hexamita inflata]|uniref:DUF2252 family protein n=1 Tax=Hexamita inflata TaxID=28002 RepID=A0AA86NUG9_9EUKA|nr:DUF2252 family protein [Hexamita inflata]
MKRQMELSEYELKMLQLFWNTLTQDQALNILNDNNITSLSFINHLKVKQLRLFQCENVIPVLNSDLKELEIEQCDLQTLTGLKLNELQVLKAQNNNIKTISGSQFPKLQELDLSYNKNFYFAELQFTNQIYKLTLRECNIYDTNVLYYLDNLSELDLSQNALQNTQALENLTILTKLRLSRCRISNLECLTHLYFLEELDVSFNKSVDDITPLSKLSKLTKLNMAWCGLKNIFALRNLTLFERTEYFRKRRNRHNSNYVCGKNNFSSQKSYISRFFVFHLYVYMYIINIYLLFLKYQYCSKQKTLILALFLLITFLICKLLLPYSTGLYISIHVIIYTLYTKLTQKNIFSKVNLEVQILNCSRKILTNSSIKIIQTDQFSVNQNSDNELPQQRYKRILHSLYFDFIQKCRFYY